MRDNSIQRLLDQTKQLLGWESASKSAKDWWKTLEQVNEDRVDLVVELAEELLRRGMKLDDFFLICCYSGRQGVRENLDCLDRAIQDRPPLLETSALHKHSFFQSIAADKAKRVLH